MRWLPVDLLLVAAFAALGRVSHGEDLAPGHWWHTAWPFLLGVLAGWALLGLLRRAPATAASGAIVAAATVALGMTLRAVVDQGVAVSFVIVATVFNCLFLVGARLLARVVRREPVAAAR